MDHVVGWWLAWGGFDGELGETWVYWVAGGWLGGGFGMYGGWLGLCIWFTAGMRWVQNSNQHPSVPNQPDPPRRFWGGGFTVFHGRA